MLQPPLPIRNRSLLVIGCLTIICTCVADGFVRAADGASHRRSAIVEAVSAARPAVVNLHGRKTVPVEYDTSGTVDAGHQVNGMGTGILIDPRGYILTNYHVVEGVKRIRATLADGTTAMADLVANDPTTDLAVIKIPPDKPFPVIRVGTSTDVMPGETVVAVGNAYGYEHTVTQGIISALHRSVQVSDHQKYSDLLQTDASINPGNSGGPLLNIDGDMIGINVAVRVGAQGIGFAIPVNEAMEVAADLMSCERVSRVSYGARLETDYSDEGGTVLVKTTAADGPARQAGLQTGDIIRTVGGTHIARRLDVERALIDRQAGDEVAFSVDRDGDMITCNLVLAAATSAAEAAGDLAWSQLGLRLVPVPGPTFRKYNSRYRGGLKVADVREESPAEKHGIRRGDVLVGIHKWETISEDNVAYILNSSEFRTAQPFRFYILRNGETLFGNMRLSGDR